MWYNIDPSKYDRYTLKEKVMYLQGLFKEVYEYAYENLSNYKNKHMFEFLKVETETLNKNIERLLATQLTPEVWDTAKDIIIINKNINTLISKANVYLDNIQRTLDDIKEYAEFKRASAEDTNSDAI